MVSSDPEGAIQALRKLLNGLWVMLEVLEWSPVTQAGGAIQALRKLFNHNGL